VSKFIGYLKKFKILKIGLPHGRIAATVHKNKIYMTGGKYGGTPNHPNFRYDNDL
jgi:hypothetical protein